jgi:hypothetical protein
MMSDSSFERESTFLFPSWRAVGHDACKQRQREALTAELQASFGAARSVARGEARPIAASRHAGSGLTCSGRLVGAAPLTTSPTSPLFRWGNRPTSLWIAEDFGCCASG